MLRGSTLARYALAASAVLLHSTVWGQGLQWPTKASLLDAARAGKLAGLPEVRGDSERQVEPLTSSVLHVLQAEYGVPPLPSDRQCRKGAADEVFRLLAAQAKVSTATLSQRPPTFTQPANLQALLDDVRVQKAKAGTGGGWCEVERSGSRQPHPYGAALSKLSDDFARATSDWVEAERSKWKAAHAAEQSREQAAVEKQEADKQRAEAERKAAEQRRIDAERARIEADEKRRREQDKKRIAG